MVGNSDYSIIVLLGRVYMADIHYTGDRNILDQCGARRFQKYFDLLLFHFGGKYKIFVRSEDFQRSIAAGIVNKETQKAVTIYFLYGSSAIDEPLSLPILEMIKNHFSSPTPSLDLVIHRPS